MATVPSVGDIVSLNDYGLKQIFGSSHGLSHMKSLKMTVTHVDDVSMTFPEATFCMEVDNADINMYLTDNWCFDIVRKL